MRTSSSTKKKTAINKMRRKVEDLQRKKVGNSKEGRKKEKQEKVATVGNKTDELLPKKWVHLTCKYLEPRRESFHFRFLEMMVFLGKERLILKKKNKH